MKFPHAEALTHAQRMMLAWAVRETAPWRARRVKQRYAATIFEKLEARWPPVFRYRISGGQVHMADKDVASDLRIEGLLGRARLYRGLFQEAVQTWCPDLETVLCLAAGDKGHRHRDVPTFCFQKEYGHPEILLPDIDFLINHYYADFHHSDTLQYSDKAIHASFVGTLTGGRLNTQSVRERTVPRLEAAAHFHGDPDVTFRLPHVVTCEDSAAREALAALPYIGGEATTWWEQRANRFLISMDGNGATCSRVVIALKSNSVLLKYDSPHRLFYFDGLSPWRHFIPIAAHQDVNAILALERASPGLFEFVAAEGRAFAETYLTRENLVFYTAALLTLYSQCLVNPKAERAQEERKGAALAENAAPASGWVLIAHQYQFGDVRARAPDWVGMAFTGRPIEGFSISAPDHALPPPVRYRARNGDGTLTPWVAAGLYCGTRGQGLALTGLQVELTAEGAPRGAGYEARFVDGHATGLLPFGQICVSPSGAALEAFRLQP